MKKILVIDDDHDLLQILKAFLQDNGFEISTADSGKKGLRLLNDKVDLVLCDIKLPDFNGLEILSRMKKLQAQIPVVMVTGYSDVNTAVEALRRGAKDYVTKPLLPDEILALIKELTEVKNQPRKQPPTPLEKRKKTIRNQSADYVKGESDVMKRLDKNIALVAPTDMSVVIEGETGTGKEYAAKRVHSLSKRSNMPFVSLDCGALPEELAASELFGHKKGAFTGATEDKIGHFEQANRGTLFLDEIGNLSYDNQVKFLRVLQEKKVKRLGDTKEKPVDFRLVVATNENLSKLVDKGEFREDLFYRLNEFSLALPPIRNRGKDVILFAQHFLSLANNQLERAVQGFSDGVETVFQQYHWPGNLRELRNLVKRAVLVCDSANITKQQIPAELFLNINFSTPSESDEDIDLRTIVETAEKNAIVKALKKYHFNKTKVAKVLKVDRKTLYNKINAYEIGS